MNLAIHDSFLETPRLVLEPIMPHHAHAIYENLTEPKLYQFIPQDPPLSLEELETRYRLLALRKSPDGQELWLNWAARLCKTQIYIGVFQATVHADLRAEIAYTVFLQYWRQGYGKEGCRGVLNNIFTNYKITTIAAEIDTRNLASIRLVESLGFQCESVIKNADFFKGSQSDEYRYKINKSDLLP